MKTPIDKAQGEGNCVGATQSRKGYWHMPKTIARGVGMTNPSGVFRAQHGKREMTADEYDAVMYHIVLDTVPANGN